MMNLERLYLIWRRGKCIRGVTSYPGHTHYFRGVAWDEARGGEEDMIP